MHPPESITINNNQGMALSDVLRTHVGDAGPIHITQQGDLSLVVSFPLVTVEITTEGTTYTD